MAEQFKSVIQSNTASQAISQLESSISEKSQQILQLCDTHFHEFIDCLDQLLKVKTHTASLEEDATRLNEQIQNSGVLLLNISQELLRGQFVLENVDQLLVRYQRIIYIMEVLDKVSDLIDKADYSTALDITLRLQSKHISQILHISAFSHGSKVEESPGNLFPIFLDKYLIPYFQNIIKHRALFAFRDYWLVLIRHNSAYIGYSTLEITSQSPWEFSIEAPKLSKIDFTTDFQKQKQKAKSHVSYNNTSIPPESGQPNPSTDTITNPVYRIAHPEPLLTAIHVFDVLGEFDSFRTFYKSNRKLQADILLKIPVNFDSALEEYYSSYSPMRKTQKNTTKNIITDDYLFFDYSKEVDQIRNVYSSKIISIWNTYLCSIVGFFAIERDLNDTHDSSAASTSTDSSNLRKKTKTLLTSVEIADFWNFAVQQIQETLQKFFTVPTKSRPLPPVPNSPASLQVSRDGAISSLPQTPVSNSPRKSTSTPSPVASTSTLTAGNSNIPSSSDNLRNSKDPPPRKKLPGIDTRLLVAVKHTLTRFFLAIQYLQLSPQPISDMLVNLFHKYSDFLTKTFVYHFGDIVQNDTYTALRLSDPVILKQWIYNFSLSDSPTPVNSEITSLSRTQSADSYSSSLNHNPLISSTISTKPTIPEFQFSSSVPHFVFYTISYLRGIFSMSSELPISLDSIFSTFELFLTSYMINILEDKINTMEHSTLSQACMLALNIISIAKSCTYLESCFQTMVTYFKTFAPFGQPLPSVDWDRSKIIPGQLTPTAVLNQNTLNTNHLFAQHVYQMLKKHSFDDHSTPSQQKSKRLSNSTGLSPDSTPKNIVEELAKKVIAPSNKPVVSTNAPYHLWKEVLQRSVLVSSQITSSSHDQISISKLIHPYNALLNVQHSAEDLVIQVLTKKITEYMTIVANINWTPSEYPTEPHLFIQDLVQYFEINFSLDHFANIPLPTRQNIVSTAFQFISLGLLGYIFGAAAVQKKRRFKFKKASKTLHQVVAINEFNQYALVALSLDYQVLAQFTTSTSFDIKASIISLEQFLNFMSAPDPLSLVLHRGAPMDNLPDNPEILRMLKKFHIISEHTLPNNVDINSLQAKLVNNWTPEKVESIIRLI